MRLLLLPLLIGVGIPAHLELEISPSAAGLGGRAACTAEYLETSCIQRPRTWRKGHQVRGTRYEQEYNALGQ
jgi:hypothetical protein